MSEHTERAHQLLLDARFTGPLSATDAMIIAALGSLINAVAAMDDKVDSLWAVQPRDPGTKNIVVGRKEPLLFPVHVGDTLLQCPLADDGTIHISFGQFTASFNLVGLLCDLPGISRTEATAAVQRWKEEHS